MGLLFAAPRLSYSGLVACADIAGVVNLKIWWPSQRNLRNLDQYRCCQTPDNMTLVVKAVHAVHPPPAQGHSRQHKATSLPGSARAMYGWNPCAYRPLARTAHASRPNPSCIIICGCRQAHIALVQPKRTGTRVAPTQDAVARYPLHLRLLDLRVVFAAHVPVQVPLCVQEAAERHAEHCLDLIWVWQRHEASRHLQTHIVHT